MIFDNTYVIWFSINYSNVDISIIYIYMERMWRSGLGRWT